MARGRSSSAQDEEAAELNMTPMLDVVFILLIFFIVTAVFVKEPGIEVQRPEVVNFEDKLKPTVLVAVSDGDSVWINKREVPVNDVRVELEALRAENPKGELIVQGDGAAKFSTVYSVMEAAQQVGFETQFVSVDEDAGP